MERRIKIGDVWYVREEQPIEEIEMNGNAEEPEWLGDLDWDLTRDKPGSDDVEYELIED